MVSVLCVHSAKQLVIGSAAFRESHFTPSEFLTLIEKACMSADDRLLQMTPDLALSALRRASALSLVECSKVLNICRESSVQHWEKACLLIEEVGLSFRLKSVRNSRRVTSSSELASEHKKRANIKRVKLDWIFLLHAVKNKSCINF